MPEPLLHLLPYQRAWLADHSRFKIGMVARQCGKTKFMGGIEVVEDMLAAEAAGERARWVWLSRGERQAIEAVEEGLKPLFRIYNAAFKATEYDFLADTGIRYRASEISLPGGSRVTALPSNPDTARGFTANVVLDEFAFHLDSRKIWMAIAPSISRPGLKMRILSTPNGKGNKFYDLMTDEDAAKTWKRYRVNIYDAVAQGLERDVDELRLAVGDSDLWSQEYELQWLDEASAWLSYEMIAAVEDGEAGDPERYAGGWCYIGNDIGARKDLWVAWVVEDVAGVLVTRQIAELRRAKFSEQDHVLDQLMARYRVARLAMDQTGMGEKPVEDAKTRYGDARVEGVLFTAPAKLNLATIGRERFEDRQLRIPMGNPALRADLHKIRRVVGPTGISRFVAESDAEGHADRAWALFLACAAAKTGFEEYAYQPVPTRRRFDDPVARPTMENLPPEEDRPSFLSRMRRWASL
jgi:phage FluMu gp28-like protein